jgi:hypothetical protein
MSDRDGASDPPMSISAEGIDHAVSLAVEATGAHAGVAFDARLVRRLDDSPPYVLVALGAPAGGGPGGWIVAVSTSPWQVMSWGAATEPTWPPTPAGQRDAELVWRPSAASRSPLYPLLRVSGPRGSVLIDVAGAEVRLADDGARG